MKEHLLRARVEENSIRLYQIHETFMKPFPQNLGKCLYCFYHCVFVLLLKLLPSHTHTKKKKKHNRHGFMLVSGYAVGSTHL